MSVSCDGARDRRRQKRLFLVLATVGVAMHAKNESVSCNGARDRRRQERLEVRARRKASPQLAAPRLQPITHREALVILAPAIQARILSLFHKI